MGKRKGGKGDKHAYAGPPEAPVPSPFERLSSTSPLVLLIGGFVLFAFCVVRGATLLLLPSLSLPTPLLSAVTVCLDDFCWNWTCCIRASIVQRGEIEEHLPWRRPLACTLPKQHPWIRKLRECAGESVSSHRTGDVCRDARLRRHSPFWSECLRPFSSWLRYAARVIHSGERPTTAPPPGQSPRQLEAARSPCPGCHTPPIRCG